MHLPILAISYQLDHILCNQPNFPYELLPHWVAVKIYFSSNLAINISDVSSLRELNFGKDSLSLKYTQ